MTITYGSILLDAAREFAPVLHGLSAVVAFFAVRQAVDGLGADGCSTKHDGFAIRLVLELAKKLIRVP